MALAARQIALAGASAGLAAAPHLPAPSTDPAATVPLLAVAMLVLLAVRPRGGAGRRGMVPWLAFILLAAAAGGLIAGEKRLHAIDGAAFEGEPGGSVVVRGFVSGVPRPQDGRLLIPIATADGRLAVEAPAPEGELRVGREVRAEGIVRDPAPWQAGRLAIAGIRRIVAARSVELTGRRRGGASGLVDETRDRAEDALERGVPAAEAALARGFVLGQDDRIDPATIDDFRRSGLAHLLAVSGQNVLLLALLAIPVLAALGLPLRARLGVVIALIVLYVPITGAGPSIQRAAVMGAAGIVALLAGRPAQRWYALLLAAVITLAVNPRAAADVGWQLSFAAVVGILVWARPVAALVSSRVGSHDSRLRRGLADGTGVTVAAAVATAPISAIHFETVSLASVPANLLALPAVAPVMWLGMLSAALGQLAWFPVEPINWIGSLLIGYIAQIARWLAAPAWASLPIAAPSPLVIVAVVAIVVLGSALGARAVSRRGKLRGDRLPRRAAAALAAAGALVLAVRAPPSSPAPATAAPGLSLTVLDVGQGDAILLDPSPGAAVLVDAGPPGTDLADELAERGVERLAAVVITHDQSDHSGGLATLLRRMPARAVLQAEPTRDVRAAARIAGAEPATVAAGDLVRVGALELRVLWPPGRGHVTRDRDADPNARSIVLRATWRRFDALLTGDAEAELAPIDSGPVELLKVAHHGSEDGGLRALLDRSDPRLAAISVGAGNPYGHPHPSTLAALADSGATVLRTDRDGDIEIEVTAETLRVAG